MFRYGFQLATVELFTMGGIYLIRLIIDYLRLREAPIEYYPLILLVLFCIFRWLAILIRNYYDLHVYNFYRYVQSAIQAWIFKEVAN